MLPVACPDDEHDDDQHDDAGDDGAAERLEDGAHDVSFGCSVWRAKKV